MARSDARRLVPMWQARFATPRAGELHLRPFLLGSTVCDCDHPAVAALSLELVGRCTSVAEAAASVRAWVREHIVYTLQDKSDLASQTLAKREGMCTNKANLQVALLRAAGIPGTRHAHARAVATAASLAPSASASATLAASAASVIAPQPPPPPPPPPPPLEPRTGAQAEPTRRSASGRPVPQHRCASPWTGLGLGLGVRFQGCLRWAAHDARG